MRPNEHSPLVSVICGYFNRKRNLEQCINSILNQSYNDFEFIIFDDCSTDGTSELLSNISDQRIRLYRHPENIGFTNGIISAIARSSGKYIAIQGAGDESFPSRLEKQVAALENDPSLGLVGCKVEDVFGEVSTIHTPTSNNFTQGEVMYRKELYYRVGGYNSFFKYGQFTHLKQELLKHSNSSYINEVLYRRIHFENGVTKNPSKRFYQKFLILSGIHLSSSENNLMRLQTDKLLFQTYVSLVKENSDADASQFFEHFKGALLVRLLVALHSKRILASRTFLRLANALDRF